MGIIEVSDTVIGRVVRLSGELGIDQAAELRQALLKAFEDSLEVKLDVSMVLSADLACMQVLCAAHRMCVKGAKKMALSAPPSSGLIASMKDIALDPSACDTPYDRECLWAREAGHE